MASEQDKAEGAFRTIGEVAAELGVPQHILRFWETKFPQLRPVKRSGNRRYYRPADVALAQRIHQLLNKDGYTIGGVQRLLRKRGAMTSAVDAGDEHGGENVEPSVAMAVAVEPIDAAIPAAPASPPSQAAPAMDRAALQSMRDALADALRRSDAALAALTC